MPDGLAGFVRQMARKWAPGLLPAEALPQQLAPWRPRGEAGVEAMLLEAQGLYKAYGGVVPTNGVDIRIRSGHVHSLIGPNGAGKTTLLNILSGIVPPDRGSIRFNGRDVTGLPPYRIARAGLGRTFQNLKLFAGMSVLDNVKLGLHAHIPTGFFGSLLGRGGGAERAARDEALQILDALGLRDKAQEIAGSLPYGVQRRLELARALATHPRLLLLDEPAAGLNPRLLGTSRPSFSSVQLFNTQVLSYKESDDLVRLFVYGTRLSENNTILTAFTTLNYKNDTVNPGFAMGFDLSH